MVLFYSRSLIMLILVYISCHMYTCTHFNYGNIFIFIAVSNILEVHVTVQCPLDLYCIVHTDKSMLGTFPKAFSQAATSQGYFPKWQLHECVISQAVTSQMYIFPNDNFQRANSPAHEGNRQLPKCTSQVTISLNNLLYFL